MVHKQFEPSARGIFFFLQGAERSYYSTAMPQWPSIAHSQLVAHGKGWKLPELYGRLCQATSLYIWKELRRSIKKVAMPLLNFSECQLLAPVLHFYWKEPQSFVPNPDDAVSVLSGLFRQLGQIKCISVNAGAISSQGQRIHCKNLTNVKATICFDHAWLGQMVFVLIVWSQFYIIFLWEIIRWNKHLW